MVLSAMELQFGVFGFLPTRHAEKQTKCVHDLHVPFVVLRMFTFTLGPQYMYTHLTNHSYFDRGKPLYPQLEPHAKKKNGAGSGIPGLQVSSYARQWRAGPPGILNFQVNFESNTQHSSLKSYKINEESV